MPVLTTPSLSVSVTWSCLSFQLPLMQPETFALLPGAAAAVAAVIVESTYGTSCHQAREGRERRFLEAVVTTVRGGGKVLLPIVAIGRAQVIPHTLLLQCAVSSDLRFNMRTTEL